MQRRLRGIVLAACAALGCTGGVRAPNLVGLEDFTPTVEQEIRYAGSHNFVGRPIQGYEAARCLLTPAAARALAEVEADVATHGLGLRVYDCYRPQRAVDHFVRWAEDATNRESKTAYHPRVAKERLFELGYIAASSSHCRGSTVDLTLVEAVGGWRRPVDMGTPYDFFDAASHTDSPEVTKAQRANRERLRAAMERRGFENYPLEWWHYTLKGEPYPERFFDVPVR